MFNFVLCPNKSKSFTLYFPSFPFEVNVWTPGTSGNIPLTCFSILTFATRTWQESKRPYLRNIKLTSRSDSNLKTANIWKIVKITDFHNNGASVVSVNNIRWYYDNQLFKLRWRDRLFYCSLIETFLCLDFRSIVHVAWVPSNLHYANPFSYISVTT